VENIYTHSWRAYLRFHSIDFHQIQHVAQVAVRAEAAVRAQVLPVLVELHQLLSASSVFVDSLLCHFGLKGIHPFDFYKPLPVSFYRSLHLCMPRNFNASLLLFLDFGVRILN
jgi:hypothetical protein